MGDESSDSNVRMPRKFGRGDNVQINAGPLKGLDRSVVREAGDRLLLQICDGFYVRLDNRFVDLSNE
ncbi:MAG: hypothetical protein RIC55_04915 [Pirellulaceae bacterium]